MCTKKEYRSLDFQDFYGFNLAMLGKQGWKLLFDPNALISHIYKARYYLRRDFLKASLGNNPSFTWRSFWSSRVLLEGGCRWKIGYGRNICVRGNRG